MGWDDDDDVIIAIYLFQKVKQEIGVYKLFFKFANSKVSFVLFTNEHTQNGGVLLFCETAFKSLKADLRWQDKKSL